MNILVFSPDASKLKIISFALESRLGIHVLQAGRVDQAFEHLLADGAVDLLVIADPGSTPLFVKYLASLGSKIPVILIDPKATRPEAQFPGINIAAQLGIDTVLQDLPALIDANYDVSLGEAIDADYCRIGVELLIKLSPLGDDVFVKLSNVKYVKLFNADASFTDQDLARIWGVKKIDYLYIRQEAAPGFIKKLQGELSLMTKKAQEGDDAMLATVAQVQETIQGLAAKTGITDEVVKLTNAHVDFTMKVIGRTPQLKKVMGLLLNDKAGYVAAHSVHLAHMACCISAELNWPSNLTFQKLIFAAFIHDLMLLNPDHALIGNRAELTAQKDHLTPEETLRIENHPALAAEVVNRFPQIPSDVYQIILQHHERPAGDGFPRGLTAKKIAPLAAVFIIAHEVVDEIHRLGEAFDFPTFWASRDAAYATGTFREVLKKFTADAAAA